MPVPNITIEGVEGLPDAMVVMACAFDPVFGEAWTSKQCLGVLALPGAALLIARLPDPTGFALLRTIAGEAELMLLAVAPQARCAGIGRALVEASFRVAKDFGAQDYFLEVRHDNPAVTLYENLDFQRVGIRRDYYRGNDGIQRDALTYARKLS